jgi:protoporphyrinogen oxidase
MTDAPPKDDAPEVVVIGAGPAGLTAAYQLSKDHVAATILEADDMVGGISRTAERDGWRFDIGGHRFFTKVASVEAIWHEILDDDEFLTRPRLSRIYYQGKFYDYPIKPLNALRNLGFVESVRCAFSYLWAKIRPPKDQSTLEGYVVADYGRRLYEHFFRTYNIKVWNVDPKYLSRDFGAQRIKGMSLWAAVWEPVRSRLFGRRDKTKQVTSLIEEFQYPKYGPGMMWERCADIVTERGARLHMNTTVTTIKRDPESKRATAVVARNEAGETVEYPADEVISTMPFSYLLKAMDPPPPPEVIAAADQLRFRDFLTVALVVPVECGFPDNWIYIHAPEVQVGRIQNFGQWSPYMVKDGRTCLGLEYFVFEGEGLWSKPDDELIALGTHELSVLGLVEPSKVEAGYVVRMPKAYPVYDEDYKENVAVLRRWLEANVPNVHPVGRNGMHKYNNQDHSMLTAMLTVENILGRGPHDIWSVNVEEEYHEEGTGTTGSTQGTGRDAPIVPSSAPRASRPGDPVR